jgi:hypothetical protein
VLVTEIQDAAPALAKGSTDRDVPTLGHGGNSHSYSYDRFGTKATFPSLAVPVVNQKLNPDIMVMQPTQNGDAGDEPELLRAPKSRRIFVQ